MKNFCVITNSIKDEKNKTAEYIKEYIEKKNGSCVVLDCINKETKRFQTLDPTILSKDLECVITIGGDGTLLHSAKDLMNLDVVFIGINRGTLGFLAEISIDNLDESLDKLIEEKFNVESRMMLKGEVYRNDEKIYETSVLNDIVVHRGGDITISGFNVFVNGQLLSEYNADGIVLATPTGSTGYNLSAGGPVARPDSNLIILTPICPHTIGNRSILLSENDEIEIEVAKARIPDREERKISFDGDNVINIITNDRIRISRATETTEIAKLDKGSFLQVMKNKLGD